MDLPEFIGFPGAMSDDGLLPAMREQILKTMPVAYITPCTQKNGAGLEIYHLEDCWGEYFKYLAKANVYPGRQSGPYLKIIYQDISPIGESYNNRYDSSVILGGLQDGISQVVQEALFASGKPDLPTAFKDVLGNSKNETIAKIGKDGYEFLKQDGGAVNAAVAMGADRKIANQIRTAVADGKKIDFPLMWKGSNYSAQYDITIRLYNPIPANDKLYQTLIVGPTAALMALSLPKSTDTTDMAYQYPFSVKFRIPGLVNLKAGYISNLTILKGGDVNDKAWNNRPNIVDIKLTISPMYSTAVMTIGDGSGSAMPTLKDEVSGMLDIDRIKEGLTSADRSDIFTPNMTPSLNISPANTRSINGIQTDAISAFTDASLMA